MDITRQQAQEIVAQYEGDDAVIEQFHEIYNGGYRYGHQPYRFLDGHHAMILGSIPVTHRLSSFTDLISCPGMRHTFSSPLPRRPSQIQTR